MTGSFTVTWALANGTMAGRLFNSLGVVGVALSAPAMASVINLAGGGFELVWSILDTESGRRTLYARAYGSDGNALSAVVQINDAAHLALQIPVVQPLRSLVTMAASEILVGGVYTITDLGDTNWQALGAMAGASVGTQFEATANGSTSTGRVTMGNYVDAGSVACAGLNGPQHHHARIDIVAHGDPAS